MRVGEFYVLCGLADETGLLWYETKFSKQLKSKPTRGWGRLPWPRTGRSRGNADDCRITAWPAIF